MTLAATIEVNDGTLTPTGIVVVLVPGSDPTVPAELWRAPDSAGAPDTANAFLVVSQILPPGGIHFVDRLPTDGAIWWYRQRMNGNAYGPGTYTDWVNLGAADRLSVEAIVALDSDATRSSAAWEQQTARPGTHTQQMLPNFGAEDGLLFWAVNSGAATVITDSTKAHGGNRYFQVTSTTGVRSNIVSADDAGRKRWFEVSPGDVVQWGGWVDRESGTDNCQVLLQTADKDQATVLNYVAGPNNTAAYVFVQSQLVIPAGIKYVTVFCDVEGNGTATVARFDDVFLRIAFSSSTIHNAQGSVLPLAVDGFLVYKTFSGTVQAPWVNVTWTSKDVVRPDRSTMTIPASSSMPAPPTPSTTLIAGTSSGTFYIRTAYCKGGCIVGVSSEVSATVSGTQDIRINSPATPVGDYDGWIPIWDTTTNREAVKGANGQGYAPTAPVAFGTNVLVVGVPNGAQYTADWLNAIVVTHTSGAAIIFGTTYHLYPYYNATFGSVAMGGPPETSFTPSYAAAQNGDGHYSLAGGSSSLQTYIDVITPSNGVGSPNTGNSLGGRNYK